MRLGVTIVGDEFCKEICILSVAHVEVNGILGGVGVMTMVRFEEYGVDVSFANCIVCSLSRPQRVIMSGYSTTTGS
jgi:hypothetical protein